MTLIRCATCQSMGLDFQADTADGLLAHQQEWHPLMDCADDEVNELRRLFDRPDP